MPHIFLCPEVHLVSSATGNLDGSTLQLKWGRIGVRTGSRTTTRSECSSVFCTVGTRDMARYAQQQGVSCVADTAGVRCRRGHVMGRCAEEDIARSVAVHRAAWRQLADISTYSGVMLGNYDAVACASPEIKIPPYAFIASEGQIVMHRCLSTNYFGCSNVCQPVAAALACAQCM